MHPGDLFWVTANKNQRKRAGRFSPTSRPGQVCTHSVPSHGSLPLENYFPVVHKDKYGPVPSLYFVILPHSWYNSDGKVLSKNKTRDKLLDRAPVAVTCHISVLSAPPAPDRHTRMSCTEGENPCTEEVQHAAKWFGDSQS